MAVPFAAQEATLVDIRPHVTGKIVVDTTVPLAVPPDDTCRLPPETAADTVLPPFCTVCDPPGLRIILLAVALEPTVTSTPHIAGHMRQ